MHSASELEAGDWIRRFHALQHAGMRESLAEDEISRAYERVERARGDAPNSDELIPSQAGSSYAEAPRALPTSEQVPR